MDKKFKIYTKTGDKGETSLIGGRVSKTDDRIEAIGSIDEANAMIGLAIHAINTQNTGNFSALNTMKMRLTDIQHHLFDCGADMANAKKTPVYKLQEKQVYKLERWIDAYNEVAPPLTRFILPAGSGAASFLHAARTVVRRAERQVIQAKCQNPYLQQFLNRLSDFLFVLARAANVAFGVEDVFYETDFSSEN